MLIDKLVAALGLVHPEKIAGLINEIPVVNLVPMFGGILRDLPKAWEALPDDKKQEYLQSFIAAGAKAAANYAGEK